MARIETAEKEQLLECDACGRITRLDYINRAWIETDFFRFDTLGGGPLENGNEQQITLCACSVACFKQAMKEFSERHLKNYLKARSS